METLRIGGVDCRSLADEFGTPLYVYDEAKIMKQADEMCIRDSCRNETAESCRRKVKASS